MSKRFKIMLMMAAALAAGPHAAAEPEIYQCIGPDGSKVFADHPCDEGLKAPYECHPASNGVRTFGDKGCAAQSAPQPAAARVGTAPSASPEPAKQATLTASAPASPMPDLLKPMWSAVINALIQLITQLWWVIAIIIVLGLVRLPVVKGYLGELLVRIVLRIGLPRSEYTVFNHLTLRASDGTTQIDHLVISRFGLFVIETKTMKGWIFGRANEATWTQQTYRRKEQFQNPLRQNYRHMAVLEELLGIAMSQQYSLIAFVGSAEFRTGRPPQVVSAFGLLPAIKSERPAVCSSSEAQAISRRVEALKLAKGRTTNRLHVADLARRHQR